MILYFLLSIVTRYRASHDERRQMWNLSKWQNQLQMWKHFKALHSIINKASGSLCCQRWFTSIWKKIKKKESSVWNTSRAARWCYPSPSQSYQPQSSWSMLSLLSRSLRLYNNSIQVKEVTMSYLPLLEVSSDVVSWPRSVLTTQLEDGGSKP